MTENKRLVWDTIPSPLGDFYLAATREGVCRVAFGISSEEFISRLDPLAHVEQNPAALREAFDQILAYFDRPVDRFSIPLDLSEVTPFQRAALQKAREIPAGSVWTYKQLADAVGRPKASRAVGQAMARNPVPILIPCHRVVGSDGSLTGYGGAGGVATKRRLLELEGAL